MSVSAVDILLREPTCVTSWLLACCWVESQRCCLDLHGTGTFTPLHISSLYRYVFLHCTSVCCLQVCTFTAFISFQHIFHILNIVICHHYHYHHHHHYQNFQCAHKCITISVQVAKSWGCYMVFACSELSFCILCVLMCSIWNILNKLFVSCEFPKC